MHCARREHRSDFKNFDLLKLCKFIDCKSIHLALKMYRIKSHKYYLERSLVECNTQSHIQVYKWKGHNVT
jgi:hypothetical protein